MKNIYRSFCLLLLIPVSLVCNAQTELNGSSLNVNNVNAMFYPVGNHFCDFQGHAMFEVPAGSGTHSIFNSTLWIGGKSESEELYLCAERFRQEGYDYVPGPLLIFPSLDTFSTAYTDWNRMWQVDLSEIETFITHFNNPDYPDYQIPQSIIDWPAYYDAGQGNIESLAPFVDVNQDNIYNPQDGDYPQIRGDRCLFFVFNDYRDHTESGGLKMGVEVRGMAYAFNIQDNDAFNNTVFLHYDIVNRSSETYYTSYIGVFTDFDIGYPNDDYIGCNVEDGYFYGYNGDNFDESVNGVIGYGENPPAQATVILGGPYIDPNQMDDVHSFDTINSELVLNCAKGDITNGNINGLNFQDGVLDNERYGMTRFVFFNNSGSGSNPATLDPSNSSEYYNNMNGYWLDNSPICYGGTGHTSGGANPSVSTAFMFPGSPTTDPCGWGQGGIPSVDWSEESENNASGDRRGVGVSGPFTFLPGAVQEFDIAYVFGIPTIIKSGSADVLKENVKIIRNGFVNNITPAGNPFIVSEVPGNQTRNNFAVTIFPNPANNNLTIELNSDKNTSVSVEVTDINGRVYLSENIPVNSGENKSVINISSLSSGIYFVSIDNGEIVTNKKLVVLR